jgi:hypothetical protein
MNQSTHAWLAVQAYRKVAAASKTPEGKKNRLDGLEKLLGSNLRDVVVAAWLPDSLIKDMSFGHVFKNSVYTGDQKERFRIDKKDLKSHLPQDAEIPKKAFDLVPDAWWNGIYRVKENSGGHLPARVNALCQTTRDMLRMGDKDVQELTGVQSEGARIIADSLLYSPRDIAMMLWMMSHYIADGHMPFHCDNRALASSSAQKTHLAVEDLWGEEVPDLFHADSVLRKSAEEILAAECAGEFKDLDLGRTIKPLKNEGDPWKEAVYICRASFAASYALVPPEIAPVDDKTKKVGLVDMLNNGFCGKDRFWNISRAIMMDSSNSIAMFWQDAWVDFVGKTK